MAFNASATSALGGTATVTITGIAGLTGKIYAIDAWTSAGAAQVTVQEAGVTRWLSPTGWVTTALTTKTWSPLPLLSNAAGNSLTITAGGQGGGNTVTLNVQGDLY